jgi:hypothetical protein
MRRGRGEPPWAPGQFSPALSHTLSQVSNTVLNIYKTALSIYNTVLNILYIYSSRHI